MISYMHMFLYDEFKLVEDDGKSKGEENEGGQSAFELLPSEMYRIQHENGRYLPNEHPFSATSWKESGVVNLAGMRGTMKTKAHMCRFHMTQGTDTGRPFIKKPSGFPTSSPMLVEQLNRVCKGNHEHIALEGKPRTVQAQIYPPELCRAICKGIRNQKQLGATGLMISSPPPYDRITPAWHSLRERKKYQPCTKRDNATDARHGVARHKRLTLLCNVWTLPSPWHQELHLDMQCLCCFGFLVDPHGARCFNCLLLPKRSSSCIGLSNLSSTDCLTSPGSFPTMSCILLLLLHPRALR